MIVKKTHNQQQNAVKETRTKAVESTFMKKRKKKKTDKEENVLMKTVRSMQRE